MFWRLFLSLLDEKKVLSQHFFPNPVTISTPQLIHVLSFVFNYLSLFLLFPLKHSCPFRCVNVLPHNLSSITYSPLPPSNPPSNPILYASSLLDSFLSKCVKNSLSNCWLCSVCALSLFVPWSVCLNVCAIDHNLTAICRWITRSTKPQKSDTFLLLFRIIISDHCVLGFY